ncbi:MAG: hypothetical protein PWP08_650 [Methanofollis sp.]|nr:hypothetical protein [Methanofollis sp.]
MGEQRKTTEQKSMSRTPGDRTVPACRRQMRPDLYFLLRRPDRERTESVYLTDREAEIRCDNSMTTACEGEVVLLSGKGVFCSRSQRRGIPDHHPLSFVRLILMTPGRSSATAGAWTPVSRAGTTAKTVFSVPIFIPSSAGPVDCTRVCAPPPTPDLHGRIRSGQNKKLKTEILTFFEK